MKIMKKIAGILLALCIVCPCFGSVAFAASGVAFFTDLETKVGDTFVVTGTVVARDDVLGDATIELTYDTSYIRFMEGDAGVQASAGKITFTGSGDGESDRLTFNMTFQALQEGSTKMDQTGAVVTTESGETVDCDMGYSAIEIGEGDPSKILPETNNSSSAIVVDGVEYTISEVFSELEIPTGYTEGEMTYEDGTYRCVVQETSGVKAVYLTDAQGGGSFFIYDEAKGSFYPFEEIMISDTYAIVILDGTDEVKMPEKYAEASVEINGVDFPVWIEPDRDGFYIFYAVNSDGQKSLYLYDSEEHTYQRMETPATAESENTEVSTADKILAVIEENLVWVLVGVGCALIVLIILCIVLAVKLRHRNLELDDLYDEYGIDLDEKEEPKASKVKADVKKETEKDYYSDFDEYEDDEYEDDEYEDDEYEDDEYEYEDDEYEDDEYEYEDDEYEDVDYYEEDDLADLRREFTGSTKSSKKSYDSFYDDGDFDEDYYDAKSNAKLRMDDTFEMNFIDLE